MIPLLLPIGRWQKRVLLGGVDHARRDLDRRAHVAVAEADVDFVGLLVPLLSTVAAFLEVVDRYVGKHPGLG